MVGRIIENVDARPWPMGAWASAIVILGTALALDAWWTASPGIGAEDGTESAAASSSMATEVPAARFRPDAHFAADPAARSCTGLGSAATRAMSSPGTWVTSDDYPVDAIRRNAQGLSQIAFHVTAAGRVDGCAITGTSGDLALDAAACRLVTERARYQPARDADGCPTASPMRTLRFRWVLPAK